MFGIPVWGGYLIGALLLAGSFYAGIKVESDHRDAAELKTEKVAITQYTIQVGALQDTSAKLETHLEEIHLVTETVTRWVDRIVTAPIYARDCFDADGLSAANAALTGSTTGAGEPRPTLSVTVPAGGRQGSDGAP